MKWLREAGSVGGTEDLSVGRLAGNIETTAQLGSKEFAAAAGGVKLTWLAATMPPEPPREPSTN